MTPKIMLKRRAFLTYFGLGCFASCFPVVLAACAPQAETSTDAKAKSPEPTAEDKGGAKQTVAPLVKTADGYSIVGKVTDLLATGQIQAAGVAVTRDPANPKQLLAVNPKCTHKGCTVDWVAAEKKYECPCHNAKFAANGKVLKGPATKPLAILKMA